MPKNCAAAVIVFCIGILTDYCYYEDTVISCKRTRTQHQSPLPSPRPAASARHPFWEPALSPHQHMVRRLSTVSKPLFPRQHYTTTSRRFNEASTLLSAAQSASFDTDATASDATSKPLNHLDGSGAAHMVDITHKKVTNRTATASALLSFSSAATYLSLKNATIEKGDAIAVARIAAVQAAKKTADLIPLAHPGLGLTGVSVIIEPYPPIHLRDGVKIGDLQPGSGVQHHPVTEDMEHKHGGVRILATVSCDGKTGVEMEALTAANVGALTMYDMLKGVDKCMHISGVRVLSKKGGKSGDWTFDFERNDIRKMSPDMPS